MTIAEQITRAKSDYVEVYNNGYAMGKNNGFGDGRWAGIEEGRQEAYDEFWDAAQNNGGLLQTTGLFMGRAWNNVTLKPKYPVVVNSTYMMFAFCGYNGDLDDVFDKRGLSLTYDINMGASARNGYMFYDSFIKAVGLVDISALTNTTQVASFFNTSTLETIRNLIPPKCAMGASCWGAGLTNLGIGGEITKDFDLSRCPKLTTESVQSVIDHLADVTGQTSLKLTLHNTVGSKLTEAQKQQITAKNWTLAY